MHGWRASIVVTAATLLLLALSAPAGAAITRPRTGAIVGSPPLLNWPAVPGAVQYNLQLYRQTARGTRKILGRWPARSRFQLHWRWRYGGRLRHFVVGRYFWYVWPWYGSRYGGLRVSRSFVRGRPPVNTSPPTLTGDSREGATLSAIAGTWTGLPQPSLAYRWQQCAPDGLSCADIPGATLSSYRVAAGDIDRVVRLAVDATNIARTVTARSAPSTVIRAAPPNNFSRPAVLGHPHVGATLTAAPGGWLSSRSVTFSYRWLRCSRDGRVCTRITGAAASTYRVRAFDAAQRLTAVVRARNSGGASEASSPRSTVVGLLVFGTNGADLLRGTLGSDLIRAGSGADTVYGGRGADRIYAGGGPDYVYGGAGADVIRSRDRFRDWIDCGIGFDTVRADRLDRVSSNCERVIRT